MLNWYNIESDAIIAEMYTKEYVGKLVDPVFIKNEISKHKKSLKYEHMVQGVAYYNEQHKILDSKENVIDIGGQSHTILHKSNFKPVHDFHTLFVDHKKDYLVGNSLIITFDDQVVDTDKNVVIDLLGANFTENIQELVLGTSNKSEEWGHYFVDTNGLFNWVVIPAEQVIAFYDGKFDKFLSAVLRYYTEVVTNIETGKEQKINRVEWWTPEDVTYYKSTGNGTYAKDPDYEVNPRPHVIKGDFLENEEKKELQADEKFSFGSVPFIPLYNNTARKTDLQPIKSLIDLYDKLIATGANTIVDLQEAIWEVKGYEGSDIKELTKKLKQFKVVNLASDQGSGIQGHQLDIPWDARKDLLEKTRKAIYEQGRAVNTSSDEFKNDPSGAALRAMYNPLEIKTNALQSNIITFVGRLLVAGNKFSKEFLNVEIPLDKIKIMLDKSMLMSNKENAEIAKDSKGVISDKTIVENHPWVSDPDEELNRLEEQRKKQREENDFE